MKKEIVKINEKNIYNKINANIKENHGELRIFFSFKCVYHELTSLVIIITVNIINIINISSLLTLLTVFYYHTTININNIL